MSILTVSMQKLFEDFAAMTMVTWQEVSREQLAADYDFQFHDLNATARDFAMAAVSDDVVAIRYAWTLASSVEMLDVHLFVFDGEHCSLERHYRVRAMETI